MPIVELKNNAAKALLINLLLEVVRNEYQKRRFFLYGLFLFELKRIRSLNNFVYIRERLESFVGAVINDFLRCGTGELSNVPIFQLTIIN